MSLPDGLEVVAEFVNTRDIEPGTDEIATPEALKTWLVARGLLPKNTDVSVDDVARAADLREAVRALALHNNGEPVEVDASRTVLDEAARSAGFTLRFTTERANLVPDATGVAGALGMIVASIAGAMASGSWERLKTCANDECQGVFFDRARNHSRRWCSMEVCGNRIKARSFRARQTQSE
ncbi:MAG: hypothetical protein GEU71_10050 [Actinobacteria bacterium]|nr:hypothetical protein [Actinomycetota bacterium]